MSVYNLIAIRYELALSASDSAWGQTAVPANVTVLVKELDPAALQHAVPLTLYPATAHQLTAHWTPSVSSIKYTNTILASCVE